MVYIIFDLEATCWEGYPLARQQEIIEIAAFAVQQGDNQAVDNFHQFIKPILAPQLSVYCKKLTHISQSKIDKAETFKVVWEEFLDWLDSFQEDIVLCSWGDKDIEFISNDIRLHRTDDITTQNYIDMRVGYMYLKGMDHMVGMQSALENEEIDFEGIPHNAYDDAFNLLSLFLLYQTEWIQHLQYIE